MLLKRSFQERWITGSMKKADEFVSSAQIKKLNISRREGLLPFSRFAPCGSDIRPALRMLLLVASSGAQFNPLTSIKNISRREGLNLRPAHYECAALPTELHRRKSRKDQKSQRTGLRKVLFISNFTGDVKHVLSAFKMLHDLIDLGDHIFHNLE